MMKLETTETLSRYLLIIAMFCKVDSKGSCNSYTNLNTFCSGFTLLPGQHLDLNITNAVTTKKLYLYDCSIASIPSGFYEHFKNAEFISMKHVGASVIEPNAFQKMYNLKTLGLSGNDIPEIHPDFFSDLVNLVELELPFNHLVEITRQAFKSLSNLEYLDLSFNDIATIHPESLAPLVKLRYLNLSFNEIESLQPGTFRTLTNLVQLNLDNGNLFKLEQKYFTGLSNLQYLKLDSCSISQLEHDCFSELPNLVDLNLCNNYLDNISEGTFTNLRHLEILNLKHNYLNFINEKEFYTLNKLKSLSLNFNNISWINSEVLLNHLSNLTDINLNSNAWMCDSLKDILRGFSSHNVEILDNYTTSGSNVNGIACDPVTHTVATTKTPPQNSAKLKTIEEKGSTNYQVPDLLTRRLTLFEEKYKHNSSKITLITIISAVSIILIVLVILSSIFYLHRRKKLRISEGLSIRYNDVGLISDLTDS